MQSGRTLRTSVFGVLALLMTGTALWLYSGRETAPGSPPIRPADEQRHRSLLVGESAEPPLKDPVSGRAPTNDALPIAVEGGGAVDALPSAPVSPPELSNRAPLAGFVHDEQGRPIAGAELHLRMHPNAGAFSVQHDTAGARSDALGGFETEAVPFGKYTMSVEAPHFVPAQVRCIHDGKTPLDVLMRPGERLGGWIAGNEPSCGWAGLNVHARVLTGKGQPDAQQPEQVVSIGAKGEFEFDSLPVDRPLQLSVRAARGTWGALGAVRNLARPRDARSGGPDVRLDLLPRAEVCFQVVTEGDGEPVAELEIALASELVVPLRSEMGNELFSTPDGRLCIPDVPIATACTLELRSPAGGEAQVELEASSSDKRIDLGRIELAIPAGIEIQVLDARDDEPIEDAIVHLPRRGAWPVWREATDALGRVFVPLPNEAVTISIDRIGYGPAESEWKPAMGTEHPVIVKLEQVASLRVHVLDDQQRPIAGVGFALRPLHGLLDPDPSLSLFHLTGHNRTDEEGYVGRRGVLAGTYQLECFESWSLQLPTESLLAPRLVHASTVNLQPGEEREVELSAAPRASIRLRVIGDEGPVAKARLEWLPELESVINGPLIGRTDESGEVEIEDVLLGPVRIRVGLHDLPPEWIGEFVIDGPGEYELRHE